MEMISTWPHFEEDEIEAVTAVLRSGKVNFWTGDQCQLFEKTFAYHMGSEYGVAIANGTLALELALKAIDLQPGDEVIVPARTFIATASAVVQCGGKPVVVDIDEYDLNITADTIAPYISPKTRAIIVVHLHGLPCEMDPILQLAKANDLMVIEDCAQAHGASYRGRRVGSLGDIGTFSFCQDKIMTTGGEGGMLITSNQSLYEKARSFKDHGKNFNKLSGGLSSAYRWLHDSFGSNYRMTEIQAAIGLLQLTKLESWLGRRRACADIYSRHLKAISGAILPGSTQQKAHAFYKYCFQIVDESLTELGRNALIDKIRSKGVPIFSGLCPDISLENAFGRSEVNHPVAEITARRSMMLLCHPRIPLDQAEADVLLVKQLLENHL